MQSRVEEAASIGIKPERKKKKLESPGNSLEITGKNIYCIFRDHLGEYATKNNLTIAGAVCTLIFRRQTINEGNKRHNLLHVDETVKKISYFQDMNGDWNFCFHLERFVRRIYPRITSVLHFEIEVYQPGQGRKLKPEGEIYITSSHLVEGESILIARKTEQTRNSESENQNSEQQPNFFLNSSSAEVVSGNKIEAVPKVEEREEKSLKIVLEEFEKTKSELRKSQVSLVKLCF